MCSLCNEGLDLLPKISVQAVVFTQFWLLRVVPTLNLAAGFRVPIILPSALTTYHYFCEIWTSEHDQSIVSLANQMLGLDTKTVSQVPD